MNFCSINVFNFENLFENKMLFNKIVEWILEKDYSKIVRTQMVQYNRNMLMKIKIKKFNIYMLMSFI